MRHNFSERTKRALSSRVGTKCSICRANTSGPSEVPGVCVNLGVAAHITAATPGGPRFDEQLTESERRSPNNGIWLCQKCAKYIDSDFDKFSVDKLIEIKSKAESLASNELGKESDDLKQNKRKRTQTDSFSLAKHDKIISPYQEDRVYFTVRDLFAIIAWAFLDAESEVGLSNFMFLLSVHADVDDFSQPFPVGIGVVCHLTKFVATFDKFMQMSGSELFDATDGYPDIRISHDFAFGIHLPYKIRRVNQNKISIEYCSDSVVSFRYPLSTSDLLVYLSCAFNGKKALFDDVDFSKMEKSDKDLFCRKFTKFSDFKIDINNPEKWSFHPQIEWLNR